MDTTLEIRWDSLNSARELNRADTAALSEHIRSRNLIPLPPLVNSSHFLALSTPGSLVRAQYYMMERRALLRSHIPVDNTNDGHAIWPTREH